MYITWWLLSSVKVVEFLYRVFFSLHFFVEMDKKRNLILIHEWPRCTFPFFSDLFKYLIK